MDQAGQASTDKRPTKPLGCALEELIMNNLKFAAYPAIVLLSLAAAVSAHAAGSLEVTPDGAATQNWTQAKTRAQVQQELAAARADGSINSWSVAYNPYVNLPRSSVTRAQVTAEAVAARNAGLGQMVGEDSGSFYLS